jgi:predicted small secreted protein
MKISIQFGAAFLALAAVATACTTMRSQSAGGDRVYLVGVAGGG